MQQVHRKKIFFFILITFVLSWAMIGAFNLIGYRWNTSDSFILLMLYMLMPAFSAAVSVKLIFKERFREKLALNWKFNRWWIIAWILPAGIAVSALGVSLLIPGVEYTADLSGLIEQYRHLFTLEQLEAMEKQASQLPLHPFWISLGQGLLAGFTVNALFAFGEEAGWRGYLFYELQSLNFWQSAFITGVVWGIWHFPVILMGHNYPQHPREGVLLMILFCALLSPVMSLIRIKSKSVFPAAIFHGTLNGTAGLPLIMIKGGNDLLNGVTGLAGLLVLLGLNAGIYYLYGRGESLAEN